MKGRESERGAGLVEYVIGAAILFLILVVGAVVLAKFNATTAAYAEVSELDEARAVFSDLVRNDFDGAGRNLTRPEPPGVGTEPFLITNDSNYTSPAQGVVSRPSANASLPFKTARRGFGSGTGAISYKPDANITTCHVELTGSDNSYRRISISNGSVYIYENGQLAAASFSWPGAGLVTPHQSGDSYRISLEDTPTGRRVRYYRTRGGVESLLYTSARGVMPYPLAPRLAIYNGGGSISGLELTGGPIVYLNEGAMETSLLPIDRGQRLTGPVTINGGNNITIISGDPDTDVLFNNGPVLGQGTGTFVPVSPPKRGAYSTGDYAMLIDYRSNRSGLYRVTLLDPANTTLRLSIVWESQPAWGRLWSAPSDPLPSWPVGCVLVKLSPPITYTVAADGRLVRMAGDRPATAAFGVRGFSVTEQASATSRRFNVTATLAAEGFHTDQTAANEPRSTVEYVSSPPALNLFNNQLNSTR